jgi:hypothetical protein
MKKLSIKALVLSEADMLRQNQNLKFVVSQKLPGLLKTFEQQIKKDQYEQAINTLSMLSQAASEASQMLNAGLQQKQQGSPQKSQQSKNVGMIPADGSISDEEI